VSTAFASGKYALGICDRCGFTYKLKQLHAQIENRVNTGWLVCPDCLDDDHPQYRLGEVDATDAEALENPRPDTGKDDSRTLTGDQFPADIYQDSP
jgi:hypothetical protein